MIIGLAIDALTKGNKMEDKIVVILGALWGLSEALSLIPVVKANGVLQSIFGIVGSIKKALTK